MWYEKKFASFTYYDFPPHLTLLSGRAASMHPDCLGLMCDQRVIDRAVQECRIRLRACVKAKGGYFEQTL